MLIARVFKSQLFVNRCKYVLVDRVTFFMLAIDFRFDGRTKLAQHDLTFLTLYRFNWNIETQLTIQT